MELVVNYARLNGCTDSCTIEQLHKWTCAFKILSGQNGMQGIKRYTRLLETPFDSDKPFFSPHLLHVPNPAWELCQSPPYVYLKELIWYNGYNTS